MFLEAKVKFNPSEIFVDAEVVKINSCEILGKAQITKIPAKSLVKPNLRKLILGEYLRKKHAKINSR